MSSTKNPEHEAENPAPMPKGQQGQSGTPRHDDPEGQQGGTQGDKKPDAVKSLGHV